MRFSHLCCLYYSLIRGDNELFLQKCPYEINKEWGVLENPSVDSLLRNPEIRINPILSETKQKETKTYVRQYKETLLKLMGLELFESALETSVIGYYRDMERSGIAFLMKDKEKWENEIQPEASLSLKMNYKYLERWIGAGTEVAE